MGPPQKGGNRHPNPRGGKGRICLRPGGQDPGVPQAPASRFVSLERWTGRTDDRRSGRDQQTDSRGGGKEKPERRANKETNKQRARQTKGPSARDRQTGQGKLAARCLGLDTRGRLRLSVRPSVRVSAGWRLSGSLGRCAHGLRDPQSHCLWSQQPLRPRAILLTCSPHRSGEQTTAPWGLPGDWASPAGMGRGQGSAPGGLLLQREQGRPSKVLRQEGPRRRGKAGRRQDPRVPPPSPSSPPTNRPQAGV